MGIAKQSCEFVLTDSEFQTLRNIFRELSGINLGENKKYLMSMRLESRLRSLGLNGYTEYIKLLTHGNESDIERQLAVDALTTNETYFFREPQHFNLLKQLVRSQTVRHNPFSIWSAACSTGEEAYSIAMTLADNCRHSNWTVLGTDLSETALCTAKGAVYPIEMSEQVPQQYLKKFCLKGKGQYADYFLIKDELRKKVQFEYINLIKSLPGTRKHDVVFLRNVLIYFERENKTRIIENVLAHLKLGGLLVTSHTENITGFSPDLMQVGPSLYRCI